MLDLKYINLGKIEEKLSKMFVLNNLKFTGFEENLPSEWEKFSKMMSSAEIIGREKGFLQKNDEKYAEIKIEKGTCDINQVSFNYESIYFIPKQNIVLKNFKMLSNPFAIYIYGNDFIKFKGEEIPGKYFRDDILAKKNIFGFYSWNNSNLETILPSEEILTVDLNKNKIHSENKQKKEDKYIHIASYRFAKI
jgi:hypothetical protein